MGLFGRKVKLEVTDEEKNKKAFRRKTRSNFNPKSSIDRQKSIKIWNKNPDLRDCYDHHPEHHLYLYYENFEGRPTRMRI